MNKNFLNLILYFIMCYIVFYTIFFICLGVVSTDTVIAIGLIFLFYLIYFFSNKQILNYFLMQSKNMFIFFVKIIYLVLTIKLLLLVLNKSYLKFLWYKFNGILLSSNLLDFINIKFEYIKLFYINKLNKLFLKKLFILDKSLKFLNNFESLNYNIFLNINILNINFFIFLLNNG